MNRFAFPLFVYGTLKRGGQYHEEFCGQALRENQLLMEPATTMGVLYALPEGYPALIVNHEQNLTLGSKDIVADAQLAATLPIHVPNSLLKDGGTDIDEVQGELFTYTHLEAAQRDISALDSMEGFWLDDVEGSLYHRVLMVVQTKQGNEYSHQLAWTYHYNRKPQATGIRLQPAVWS